MDRQEVVIPSPLCFFINGSTLFADPSWWNRCGGKLPALACSPVSFLTILSILGRKAEPLTLSLPVCRRPFQIPIRTDRICRGRRRTNHDVRSPFRQTLNITLANHFTLRQPRLSCIRRKERHKSEQPEHSSLARRRIRKLNRRPLVRSSLVRRMIHSCCRSHRSDT